MIKQDIQYMTELGIFNNSHWHLLWKDEINDIFILCKWGEVFQYSKSEIRCYIWSAKMYSQLKKLGHILWEDPSDDLFYTINIKLSYLPKLLTGSGFKRRPNVNGRWLKEKENRLGHRILKYSPQSFNKLSSHTVQSGGDK